MLSFRRREMTDTLTPLICDLLEWIADERRPHAADT